MIGQLTGSIVERVAEGACVLDVSGVGYEVWVPMGTLGRLPPAPDRVTLFVHTHVREDAISLYGFATASDRAAFRALLTVNSVGPKLAMSILNSIDAQDLAAAVARGDRTRLKGISGVGGKTIERIMLDLKDKLPVAPGARGEPIKAPIAATPKNDDVRTQVARMLISMGYRQSEAERATANFDDVAQERGVETLLREALQSLS